MKHAFLITAYKNPAQLARLIGYLQSPYSYVFIHLDKKCGIRPQQILSLIKNAEGVFFVQDPVKVHWGGYSHLSAFIRLLQMSFAHKDISYFHTISGQDLPVRSLPEIFDFFSRNKGKEYLSYVMLKDANWTGGSFNRIQRYHLNDFFDIRGKLTKRINAYFLRAQHMLSVKRKLAPYVEEYFAGGTWWSLSRNAIAYVLDFIKKHPDFLRRFSATHCSEEIFFQTILLNSPLKKNVVNNDLRYIDWETRNGSCPANLDISDYSKIYSSDKLFARKFEGQIGEELEEKIVQRLTTVRA